MKTLVRFCAFAGALALGAPLPAQPQSDPTPADVAAIAKAMSDALVFRVGLVAAIVRGTEPADASLERLRAEMPPSGLNLAPAADFAFAAIDIGQRLVVSGKPADAELFFKAAETSLATLLQQVPAAPARDQAQYLCKLSLIRGRYLNQVAQAKTDIEQAIALQPDDPVLQHARDNLARENAEVFKNRQGN